MTIDDKMKVETLHYDINANLGGRGWGLVILPAPPPPPPGCFSLNNSKTVKAATLEFCSIQEHSIRDIRANLV